MSDHQRKPAESDPGHVTIPPSLQGFSGRRDKPKVQRRGEDAALEAAFGGLEGVSGPAPVVDAANQDLSRGAGNLSAYAAPVEAPAAALGVRQTGKVKINVAAEDDEKAPPSSGAALRLDGRTARLMAQAAANTAEGPWAQETATVPLGAAVLPSSLAPGMRTEPVPPSVQEKPAGVLEEGNRGARVMGVLAVVAVLGFLAFEFFPRTSPQEALAPVPVRSAGAAVAPPQASGLVVAPPIAPSASAAVPPPGPTATVEVDAGARLAPSVPLAPAKVRTKIEDPYDASVPGPVTTVAPVAPPSPVPTVAPVPVPAPSGPSPLQPNVKF